jgi:type I restriction enzyme S subunit
MALAMESKEVKFYELSEIVRTITPPKRIQTSEYLSKGNFAIVDQSAALIAGWTDDENALVHPSREGLIVFGDHTCVLKFVNFSFAQGADGIKIIDVNSEVNPHYLYAHLKSFPLLNDGYKRHFSELKRLKIRIPEMRVQNMVSEILNTIDSKIVATKETSKTLEEIAETIFKSWFLDFDPVRAKMAGEKPSGMDDATAALFPESMEVSDLGLIPKGWSVLPAGELFDIGIGRTPPRKESMWFSKEDEGMPWVSIRDMGTFGVFSESTSECLTEAAVEKFRVPVVPEQTVLMSFKLTVGKLCITDRPLVTNEAIAHFRVPTDGRLDSNYAYLWLNRYDMRTLDSTSSIGTATNSGVIRNIKFLVPSREVVLHFQNTIAPIFKSLQSLHEQSTTLTHLRDALIPRLVSGELQIPEEMLAS